MTNETIFHLNVWIVQLKITTKLECVAVKTSACAHVITPVTQHCCSGRPDDAAFTLSASVFTAVRGAQDHHEIKRPPAVNRAVPPGRRPHPAPGGLRQPVNTLTGAIIVWFKLKYMPHCG